MTEHVIAVDPSAVRFADIGPAGAIVFAAARTGSGRDVCLRGAQTFVRRAPVFMGWDDTPCLRARPTPDRTDTPAPA